MGSSLFSYWLRAATVASAVGCATSIVVAVWTWRLPSFPGRTSFVVSMVGVAWWTASVAVEHASRLLAARLFWSGIAWLGVVLSTGYWAIFVWEYLHGRKHPLPRWAHLSVLSAALLIVGVALTSARLAHGPLFYLIVALFYLLVLGSDLMVLNAAIQSRSIYRAHYLGLALATVLPLCASILYVSRIVKELSFDTTPLCFAVTDVILFWLIRRRRLFDLLPIARGVLLDFIPDPVIVLDDENRIIESNPAAQRLAGRESLLGLPLSDLPELKRGLGAVGDEASARYEVAIGSPPRHFDVGRVSLPYAGRQVGQLLVLRDVTHLKEVERRLQTALSELENQLADNLALQRKLREQTIRDPLTGLHNRRFLDELGPVMLADARRSALPLAAVMIDVDRFKLLNDTYGHSAGDAVLRATGSFLRQRVRESDAVFRLGGEEFLLLLAHTREDAALERVEEWRTLYPSHGPLHEGSRLEATFSAGIAFFPLDAEDLGGLLDLADRALYQAKLEGRNRTIRHRSAAN